jgi:hypothetical protein
MIFSIDPGNEKSAFVITNDTKPLFFDKVDNDELLMMLDTRKYDKLVIEMVASYGMAVGKTVFDTCVWIGRFIQKANERNIPFEFMYRKDVKLNLCNSMRAKDSNIRQALIDRFGEVGTKKDPGFFYGFKADIWSAYAIAITHLDNSKHI